MIPKYTLNEDSVAKMSSILGLRQYPIDNAQYPNIDIYIDDITKLLVMDMLNVTTITEEVETILSKDLSGLVTGASLTIPNDPAWLAKLYAETLAIGLFLGFLQSINTDRKVRTIVETNEKGEKVEKPIIPTFGYSNMADVVTVKLEEYKGVLQQDNITKEVIEHGLHIDFNDIDKTEYFAETSNYMQKDIDYLANVVIETQNAGYNEELLECIKNSGNLGLINSIKDIYEIYNAIFEDGFGVKPFAGVYLNDQSFIEVHENNYAKKITRVETKIYQLALNVSNQIKDIHCSTKRQFDYEEILTNEGITYFPYKILEYATGKSSSLNLNIPTYLTDANATSWENYSNKYVFPNLMDVLVRGCYYIMEIFWKQQTTGKSVQVTSTESVDLSIVSQGFNTKIFKERYSSDYDHFIFLTLQAMKNTNNKNNENINSFEKKVNKILQSLKCCFILSDYNIINGQLTKVGLRVTSFNKAFTKSSDCSKKIFKGLSLNDNPNEIFPEPYDLAEFLVTANNQLSVNVLEFVYDINPVLTKAEPLFGYKVQQQNQKRGVKANWSNILLGQSPTGKEYYAKKDSAIPMQANFIHNIIAGSRSGKGVLTMNLLAAAIGSGKPLFYIDRKPDMAAVMYQNAEGKMFVVNGGQYSADHDSTPNKIWDPNDQKCPQTKSLHKSLTYLEAHPNIKELLPNNAELICDVAYYRAVIFVWGICYLRNKVRTTDKALYEQLGGDTGCVFVVDEFNNFQDYWKEVFADDNSSLLFKKAAKAGDLSNLAESIKNKTDAITLSEKMLENAKEAKNPNQKTIASEESKLKQLNEEKDNLKDISTIYATTFYQKAVSCYKTLRTYAKAGFKNEEQVRSDFFILGQDIKPNYYAPTDSKYTIGLPVFFPVQSSHPDLLYVDYKKADPIRSMFEVVADQCDEDWFLGRGNKDIGNMIPPKGQTTETTEPYITRQEDGNWDYIGQESCATLRSGATVNTHVPFKPFVVLNDADENGTYVAQCRKRCFENAGNIDIWPSVKAKNSLGDMLHPGVGFEGLLVESIKTTDPNANTEQVRQKMHEVLAKSDKIANLVASKMGYACWQDLIYDFTPYGLFDFDDIYNAFYLPEKFAVQERLSNFSVVGYNVVNYMAGEQEEITTEMQQPTASKQVVNNLDNMKFDSAVFAKAEGNSESTVMSEPKVVNAEGVVPPMENISEIPIPMNADTKSSWEVDSDDKDTEAFIKANPEVAHAQATVKKDMSDLDKGLFSIDNLIMFARMTLEMYKQQWGIASLDTETEQKAMNYLISVYVENLKLNK